MARRLALALAAGLLATTALTPARAAPVVPVVAALAGSAATAGLASVGIGGILGSIAGAVVAGGVNALGSRAFGKKPKTPALTQDAQGRTQTLRSSVESHKLVYGTARVSGPFGATTVDAGADNNGATRSGPNKFLHMVVLLAGHEVDAVTTVYLDDTPLALDAGGWATNPPFARASTETVTVPGTPVPIASAVRTLNTTVTVTTSSPHGLGPGSRVTLAGVVGPLADLNGPAAAETVASATTFTFTRYGAANGAASLSAATATPASSTQTVTTTTSFVRVKTFLGSPDQAASPELLAEVPGWRASDRFRGVAYLHLRLEFDPDVFPLGIPNPSAVVRGKKVYDPRTGLTAWSDNAALCVRDYLTARDGSALDEPFGFGCAAAEVSDTHATAAANLCDEAVPLSTGGTQARYTCNGVADTAAAPLDNLQALVSATAGAVTYVQGAFRIHPAAYDSPAGGISTAAGSDVLAGEIDVDWRAGRKELFNAVKGTFVDPARTWQPTDFPPVTNPMYEAEDGGERVFKDLELPFTTHPEAAQRLAKIVLEKGRQGVRVTLPVTHAGLKFAAWDVLTLSDQTLGWSNKPFRVLRWNLGVPGPVTLTLQEESAASYAWNSGEATAADPAPDTALPDPFAVAPPGELTVAESLYVTRQGDGVKVLAALAWGASADPFLRDYQPEYKAAVAAAWTLLPRTTGTAAAVEDIGPGAYDFRVKAVSRLGVSSAYSAASRQIAGLLSPPAEPRNLTVSTIGGLAVLRWDLSPDLDVRIGGKVVFRHSPTPTDGWTQSTTVGNAVPGGTTVAVLPLKPGVYLAKAVDSSGIESAAPASAATAQATALAFADVDAVAEDPAFPGTRTGCHVDDLGRLRLSGAGLFSAITLVSAAPSVAAAGGLRPAGTYLFSGGIDLGAVRPVRLTSRLHATVTNQLDTVGSRTAAVSTWASFTGSNAASGDARVYARTTPDDPAGSPAWGPWERLDSGEFRARAFQFKCELESHDPAYNVAVDELSVTAAEVA